jgi:hypothetical protein
MLTTAGAVVDAMVICAAGAGVVTGVVPRVQLVAFDLVVGDGRGQHCCEAGNEEEE